MKLNAHLRLGATAFGEDCQWTNNDQQQKKQNLMQTSSLLRRYFPEREGCPILLTCTSGESAFSTRSSGTFS